MMVVYVDNDLCIQDWNLFHESDKINLYGKNHEKQNLT